MWRKRMFRCVEPAGPVTTFSRSHPLAAERAALTARAITWATDGPRADATTASALARRLGVGLHTCGARRHRGCSTRCRPGQLIGVVALGEDEQRRQRTPQSRSVDDRPTADVLARAATSGGYTKVSIDQ